MSGTASRTMEAALDNVIGVVVNAVSKNKRILIALLVVFLAVFSGRVLSYVEGNISGPVRDAIAQGLTSYQVGTAFALGITRCVCVCVCLFVALEMVLIEHRTVD